MVPADDAQSALPVLTELFRTSVWSFVASATPATDQPRPGSSPKRPNISINVVSLFAILNNPRTSSPLKAETELSVVSASSNIIASEDECATT